MDQASDSAVEFRKAELNTVAGSSELDSRFVQELDAGVGYETRGEVYELDGRPAGTRFLSRSISFSSRNGYRNPGLL